MGTWAAFREARGHWRLIGGLALLTGAVQATIWLLIPRLQADWLWLALLLIFVVQVYLFIAIPCWLVGQHVEGYDCDVLARTLGNASGAVTETAVPQLELGRVGEVVARVDGIPKVTGEFVYSSDLQVAGMLWGRTLRSPYAHARIRAIDTSEALTMPGVHAVLMHEDVPGEKCYGLEFRDQPVLAFDRVRYFGEPVAVVAAEHPEQARRAAERIRVDYEPLEPIVDAEHATAGNRSTRVTGRRSTVIATTRGRTSSDRS